MTAGECQTDEETCCSTDAASSSAGTDDQHSAEIQRLHDELVASKLREAEAHLTMKEFEQKLLQLQRHWQASMFFFRLFDTSVDGIEPMESL